MTGRLECFIENLFSIWKTATGKMYPMSVLVLKVGYMISGSQCWYLKSPKQTRPYPKRVSSLFWYPRPTHMYASQATIVTLLSRRNKATSAGLPAPWVLSSAGKLIRYIHGFYILSYRNTVSTPDASGAVYSGAIYYIYFLLPSQMSFFPQNN